MAEKPLFVLTHPRACSTAFERAFLTRRDDLQTFHEPFGDAYYFGPERLSDRYEDDVEAREQSGFSQCTFQEIFDRIVGQDHEGKRVFVKDMAQYFMPDEGRPASIAPSLVTYRRGVGTSNGSVPNGVSSKPSTTTNGSKHGPPYPYNTEAEPGNPTVVPDALLRRFHFTFLIRHPRNSVPSYYRCTIPPLDDMTGFHYFDPREAGYLELRRMFDYLRGTQQCGPAMAGKDSPTYGMEGAVKTPEEVEICVIDADDLLDNPAGIMEAYCNSAGLEYTPDMLNWDNEKDQKHAKVTFEKWKGFHEDAIDSTELRPRAHKKAPKSDEQFFEEWTQQYGEHGATLIRDTVAQNVDHYEYLKQFALKVDGEPVRN